MKIQTAAKLTSLTVSTIRYYDSEGLLCTIPRDTNGFRDFRDIDVQWLKNIELLRESGVSITTLKKVAQLNHNDPEIRNKRATLLTDELRKLEQRIIKLQQAERMLKDEIASPTFVD
ncbi:MerR family transcriptional regulator [Furfurilactobacillus curtus]|uniref:HTH merR-type domain-containing protein n=1 Tax=Furfurilactobacillus curtus TaxID=1746200 RepID=A0ABQ5JND6_9LACO